MTVHISAASIQGYFVFHSAVTYNYAPLHGDSAMDFNLEVLKSQVCSGDITHDDSGKQEGTVSKQARTRLFDAWWLC